MKFESQYHDDANASFGFLFIKFYHVWHSKIQKELKIFDLTHAQFVVLTTIGYLGRYDDEVKQIDIADAIKMDAMTLSKLLKKLVKLDYISQEKSEIDLRAKKVMLTEKGENIMNASVAIVEQIDEQFMAQLNLKQKQEFIAILAQLGSVDD